MYEERKKEKQNYDSFRVVTSILNHYPKKRKKVKKKREFEFDYLRHNRFRNCASTLYPTRTVRR